MKSKLILNTEDIAYVQEQMEGFKVLEVFAAGQALDKALGLSEFLLYQEDPDFGHFSSDPHRFTEAILDDMLRDITHRLSLLTGLSARRIYMDIHWAVPDVMENEYAGQAQELFGAVLVGLRMLEYAVKERRASAALDPRQVR